MEKSGKGKVAIGLFDILYADILKRVLGAAPEKNSRTGRVVRAKPGQVIYVPPGQLPLLRLRDIKPLWTCAEIVWFLSGSSDASWMAEFGFRVWDKFADKNGSVWSATGHRWRNNFLHPSGLGRLDQLMNLIDKLEEDPSSRHGVLLSWDPTRDAVNPGPNAPCLVTWHFHIINGELHCSLMQRSADLYFGVPHDILGTRLIQELIAARLKMRCGGLTYLLSNAHLYEDQWQAAETMVSRAWQADEEGRIALNKSGHHMVFSPVDFDRAVDGDKVFVHELYADLAREYAPMPPLSGPSLAL